MRAVLSLLWIFAVVGVAFASEGAHHEVSIKMEIFRIVNFVVFVWLLYKFAGNAVKNFFSQRSRQIQESIEEAKRARSEAEKRFNEAKSKVANLEQEVQQILKNAERESNEQVAKIREETQKMVERIKQQAKAAADLEVQKAKIELQKEAIELAVSMAETMLKEKITPEDQKNLLKDYITKVKEVH